MYVKFCIYYIPFVFMKIIFSITYLIMVLEDFLLKVNIRETTPLKTKMQFPIKKFWLDCTCVNTDYFIARF